MLSTSISSMSTLVFGAKVFWSHISIINLANWHLSISAALYYQFLHNPYCGIRFQIEDSISHKISTASVYGKLQINIWFFFNNGIFWSEKSTLSIEFASLTCSLFALILKCIQVLLIVAVYWLDLCDWSHKRWEDHWIFLNCHFNEGHFCFL
jgi:hypothetical protein